MTQSSSDKPSVGFVGLGAMGYGMATHLVKQGYQVKGYDVFPKSVERFASAGGTGVSNLLESAEGVEHFICMVATAQQVEEVLFDKGVVKALPKGATVYLCSTVPSTSAIALADRIIKAGREDIFFIDSPVSGGAGRAADGTLSIMAGGSEEAIQKGKVLLEELGAQDKIYIMTSGVGAGSNMKMIHQVLACVNILASSEGLGFAARLGVDANDVLREMVSTDSSAWMVENRIPRMLAEDYSPAVSALAIILKDTSIITSTARHYSVPTPLCSVVEQHFISGLAKGFAYNDDSRLIQLYYQDPIKDVKKSEADVGLVLRLLKIIVFMGVAESIGLAYKLKVDINIFYRMATAASGASRMLSKYALPLYQFLDGAKGEEAPKGETVNDLVEQLESILVEAKKVECPLHMGAQIMSLLLMTKNKGFGDSGLESVASLWSAGN